MQSFNPFALGAQFCGEGLCLKLLCCCCFLGILVASVFLAPFLAVVVDILAVLPKPLPGLIIFFFLCMFLFPVCYLYCKWKMGR